MSGLKRAPKQTAPLSPVLPEGVPGCQMVLPTLFDFLTLASWPDGCKRTLGTVSVFWEDGRFKCWVNDKDGLRSACLSAGSLAELFLTVDTRLELDDLEWRKARPEAARGRGK